MIEAKPIPGLDELPPGTVARFMWKVVVENGCWLWRGDRDRCGYGRFTIRDVSYLAHRVAARWYIGELDPGMTLDHRCRRRECVNPRHAEEVSLAENIRRGTSPSARNARKETCPKGHRYDRTDRRGSRTCRRCTADSCRAYRARLRVAGLAAPELTPPSRTAITRSGPSGPSLALVERRVCSGATRRGGGTRP